MYTLLPRIMAVENWSLQDELPLKYGNFPFHDCGRKGSEYVWICIYIIIYTMGTHNLHFSGYDQYFLGLKPLFFMVLVLGLKGLDIQTPGFWRYLGPKIIPQTSPNTLSVGIWMPRDIYIYIPRTHMGPLVLIGISALFWRVDLQK